MIKAININEDDLDEMNCSGIHNSMWKLKQKKMQQLFHILSYNVEVRDTL